MTRTDKGSAGLPERWTHTPVPGNEEHERLHPPKDDWEQIERYRDRYIGKHKDGGTITVRTQGDPFYGEFIIALDDSKTHGNRRTIPGANNVETARNHIDDLYISKHYPDHWKGNTDDERIASTKKTYCQFLRDTLAEYRENPEPYTERQVVSAVRLLHKYQDHRGKLFVPRAELDAILEEHGLPAADQILKSQSITVTKTQEATVAEQKPKYEVFVDPKTNMVYGDSHFKVGDLKKHLPEDEFKAMSETHTVHSFVKAADAKAFVAEQQEKAIAKGHTPTPPDPNRPLTEKQIETLRKHGTKEALEALDGGHNALARKHLDALMKDWEKQRNAPLTDKQKEILTKYGKDEDREALAKGDNAASRAALNGILKEWEEKKKQPLTEKQLMAIDRHAPPEVKAAIKDGDNHAGRIFLREYAKEVDAKPLTEKQIAFINRFATREIRESVAGGNNHLGRDWLNKFDKEVLAEVTKWQNRNPDFKGPEVTVELKKAELTIRLHHLENYREVAYGQVAKEGLNTKDIPSYIKEKVQAPEKAKTNASPER